MVPNVRGMSTPNAVVRLLKARYCAELRVGTPVSMHEGMPVQRQAPPAGTTRRAWSTVTLTIGIPTKPGMPANRKVAVYTDTWGGGKNPCPPVKTTG